MSRILDPTSLVPAFIAERVVPELAVAGNEPYVEIKVAAKWSSLSPKTIREEIEAGNIVARRIRGSSIRVHFGSLKAFMENSPRVGSVTG